MKILCITFGVLLSTSLFVCSGVYAKDYTIKLDATQDEVLQRLMEVSNFKGTGAEFMQSKINQTLEGYVNAQVSLKNLSGTLTSKWGAVKGTL